MNILVDLLFGFICAIIVMIVHELPKAVVAYTLTHPIYKKKGEIDFNPLRFIDPIGVIMFMFIAVGWQKPADYNPSRLRDKEKGLLYISLMGMFSNLLLMTLLIPSFMMASNAYWARFLYILIYHNFAITIINLLPIPPFDMAKIIYSYSPNTYFKLIQNQSIIHAVFILLIVIPVIPEFIKSIFTPVVSLIVGI